MAENFSAGPSQFEIRKDLLMNPKFLASNPSYLFTLGAILGALSCFSRADYNLPMFAFLAVMWNQDDNEKNLIRLLLLVTSTVDVFWLLFWIPYYNDKEIAKWNYGLHMFVVIVSCLELALKVIIFFMLFASRGNNKPAPSAGYNAASNQSIGYSSGQQFKVPVDGGRRPGPPGPASSI